MPVTKKPRKTTKKKSTKRNQHQKRPFLKKIWWLFWRLGLVAMLLLVVVFAYFDLVITKKFEGQKWSLPAHVYTRPLDVYVGQRVDLSEVLNELSELGYQKKTSAAEVTRVGQYYVDSNKSVSIYLREFIFWNETQKMNSLR